MLSEYSEEALMERLDYEGKNPQPPSHLQHRFAGLIPVRPVPLQHVLPRSRPSVLFLGCQGVLGANATATPKKLTAVSPTFAYS